MQLSFENRVKYIISHGGFSFEINEPLGWYDDKKSYERHKDYHGVFSELSSDLTFIDDGALFIKSVYEQYDINAEITLERKSRHPLTDRWQRDYIGVLDLSEYVYDNGKVTVKFNSSGLLTLIKARQNEKVEIERLDTLDGVVLPELETSNLYLDGRRIFLVSQMGVQESEQFNEDYRYILNNTKVALLSFIINQSDEQFHAQLEQTSNSTYFSPFTIIDEGVGTTNMMFYADSSQDKTLICRLQLKMVLECLTGFSDIDYNLCIYKYENGTLYENPTLVHSFQSGTFGKDDPITFDIDSTINVDLLENESLSVMLEMNLMPIIFVQLQSTTEQFFLTVSNDSYQEPSYTKVVSNYNLADRLVKIIGGTGIKSDLLTNGDVSKLAFAHGHWIRNFQSSNLYKKFTTSLKDYLESLDVLGCVGIGIETIGQTEYLKIEGRDYFYQKFVGINLGKVTNIKRSVAKEKYFSSITVGYEKPSQSYDEAMGLDEYNTKISLTTCITRFESKLDLLSKYRADSYGIEFARRKQVTDYPTDDTAYDSEIFAIDTEVNGANLIVSKWADDLDIIPTGVFSPETAFNLMYTPIRLLLKHGKYIKQGFMRYLDQYIRYSSSVGNSGLKTTKDSIEVSENGNILNSSLDFARYGTQWIELKADITQEINEMINGNTAGVPNVYGLVEFENEFGKIERGYLFEYKQNDGTFKLLKDGI